MPYLIVALMVYPISRRIVPIIYSPWIRKVEGLENIPEGKPFIISSNHTSYFDDFLLPSIIVPRLNNKMHALVNSYYWKYFITRFFLDIWECIPVFVDGGKDSKKKNEQAVEKALNYLKKKEIVMIFPEGTRSKDGRLKKAYTGVAKLALMSKAPVLPCGIIGADKVLPREAMLPRFARCEVKIGKLMYFDKYKKTDKKTLEKITRQIMKEIAKLTNQKYNY